MIIIYMLLSKHVEGEASDSREPLVEERQKEIVKVANKAVCTPFPSAL